MFGNGGSAADAQHFAAELVGRFGRTSNGAALAAIALTTDTRGAHERGERLRLRAPCSRGRSRRSARPATSRSAITTSGASANVNEGLRWALDRSLATIALTGGDGGVSGRLADMHVNVPDDERRARAGSAPDDPARDVRA